MIMASAKGYTGKVYLPSHRSDKDSRRKTMDKGPADPKIKEAVLAYLDTVEKAKSKEIAAAINERKAAVDLAVKELAAEDLVEYLYITTTFVALKGKVAPPE